MGDFVNLPCCTHVGHSWAPHCFPAVLLSPCADVLQPWARLQHFPWTLLWRTPEGGMPCSQPACLPCVHLSALCSSLLNVLSCHLWPSGLYPSTSWALFPVSGLFSTVVVTSSPWSQAIEFSPGGAALEARA
jgi:hypothetical protein